MALTGSLKTPLLLVSPSLAVWEHFAFRFSLSMDRSHVPCITISASTIILHNDPQHLIFDSDRGQHFLRGVHSYRVSVSLAQRRNPPHPETSRPRQPLPPLSQHAPESNRIRDLRTQLLRSHTPLTRSRPCLITLMTRTWACESAA